MNIQDDKEFTNFYRQLYEDTDSMDIAFVVQESLIVDGKKVTQEKKVYSHSLILQVASPEGFGNMLKDFKQENSPRSQKNVISLDPMIDADTLTTFIKYIYLRGEIQITSSNCFGLV